MMTTEEALALVPAEKRAAFEEYYADFSEDVERLESLTGGPRHFGFDGEPISFAKWAMLFESPARFLRSTEIGPYRISTIWLGLNHNFGFEGPPLIFETMVFAKEESYREPQEGDDGWPDVPGYHYHEDFDQLRYSTQQQALADHERLVNEISLLVAANPRWTPASEND